MEEGRKKNDEAEKKREGGRREGGREGGREEGYLCTHLISSLWSKVIHRWSNLEHNCARQSFLQVCKYIPQATQLRTANDVTMM